MSLCDAFTHYRQSHQLYILLPQMASMSLIEPRINMRCGDTFMERVRLATQISSGYQNWLFLALSLWNSRSIMPQNSVGLNRLDLMTQSQAEGISKGLIYTLLNLLGCAKGPGFDHWTIFADPLPYGSPPGSSTIFESSIPCLVCFKGTQNDCLRFHWRLRAPSIRMSGTHED